MKKIFITILSFILLVTLPITTSASSNPPNFYVDGQLFFTPSGEPVPYINKEQRTMGSLRLIATALGVESKNIKWDNAKQTATLTRGKYAVSVTVGKKVIIVNGKNVTMDTVAEMKQNRIFIPARFIAQGLGMKISFDSATNTVNFITGDKDVVYHNFANYGLTQLKELPIAIAAGGLEITYHDAFLYKTNSMEGKAINSRYNIVDYDIGSHLLWMKVTLKNNSDKKIASNYSDLQLKIGVLSAFGKTLSYGFSKEDDYIYTWSLEPNESITGYVAFLKKDDSQIDRIVLSTTHGTANNAVRIAEKVN
ncbi:copper amine oxidase N-terminal domain-containing protein [Paenibacillus camelliae]|uniref:copper amine oxidase N-terminal domain-containing protein n=1 Tax=Paenibacillus camelliae TaxID=512410 RepID=UPI00203AE8AB|nr:copper amine oxidase N-terminal domain-containing protein [Paenibacillus camelliae]MCM3632916.1 copper amine oxidase N-terminal domain-containing protein [Paenibacillus camelliae]